MADAVCSKCDVGWMIHPQDKHCGYCGCQVFGFSVKWDKEPLIYRGDDAEIHDLTIVVRNDGAYPITFQPIHISHNTTIQFPQGNDAPFEVAAGKAHEVPVQVRTASLARSSEVLTIRAQDAPKDINSEEQLTLYAQPMPEFKLTPNSATVQHRRGVERMQKDLHLEVLEGQFTIKSINVTAKCIRDIKCPIGPYEVGSASKKVLLDIDCNQLTDEVNTVKLRFELNNLSKPIEKEIHVHREILKEPPKLFIPPTTLDLDITQGRQKTHSLTLQNIGEELLTIRKIVCQDSYNLVKLPDIEYPINIGKEAHENIEIKISADGLDPVTYPVNLTIHSNSEDISELKTELKVKVKELEDYPYYLAIDFGTTNSCCAYIDLDTFEPKLIPLESQGKPPEIMPSTIIYHSQPKNGQKYKVGYGAETDRTSISDGPYYISSVKRWLGYQWHRNFPDNKEIQPSEVVSHILKHIINIAEDHLDKKGIPSKIRKCVVTYPTMFLRKQRADLEEAVKKLGITKLDFIDEASAASIGYIGNYLEKNGNLPDKHRILVYDFGGGTIDIALSQVTNTNDVFTIEPLSLGGNRNYGGDDVTQSIVDYVLKVFGKRIQRAKENLTFEIPYYKQRKILNVSDDPKYDAVLISNSSILYRVAEQMKRELSIKMETEGTFQLRVVVDGNVLSLENLIDGNISIKLTENHLKDFTEVVLNETFADIDVMIDDNDGRLPDAIVLAGQSSKMPIVQKLIHAHLQKKYNRCIPIDLADYLKERVVTGAAQYVQSKQMIGTKFNVDLVEKTRSRLGILKRSGTKPIFKELIPKGKIIPDESSGTIDFTLNSRDVSIIVCEHFGRDNELTSNFSQIGSYTPDIPDGISDEALNKASLQMSVEKNGEIKLVTYVDREEYQFTVNKEEPEFVEEI